MRNTGFSHCKSDSDPRTRYAELTHFLTDLRIEQTRGGKTDSCLPLKRCSIFTLRGAEVRSHRRIGISFPEAPRGECRFCGQQIIRDGRRNKRLNWHPECADSYLMQFSSHARERVHKRDRGKCASCGRRSRKWEHDHIIPLKDGGSHALDNIQTLCIPCHKLKTAREAGARASRRDQA